MKDKIKETQILLRPKNLIIFSLSYLLIAFSISIIIFGSENFAAKYINDKLLLMAVNLIVIAPGFSVAILLAFLRMEHLFKKKDFSEFLSPEKSSLGNPTIDEAIGEKGVRILNIFVKLLIVLLILAFVWVCYSNL